MTELSADHATFVIERTYPVPPTQVFGAWADAEAKGIWMDDPETTSNGTPADMDFRIGGHERFGGLTPDGSSYRYDAVYYDIVPDQRIVYCYEMYAGDARMSVSIATVEFVAADTGTTLTYTEQGVFLDGIDKPEARQEGTEWLLDNLGTYLASRA